MIPVVDIKHHGHDAPSTQIRLDSAERHVRRKVLTIETGERILIDLAEARQLAHGMRLVLEDGRQIEIVAKDEPLLEIGGVDARHMTVLAWHIGNRHLPAEIHEDRILIQQDHVIRKMLAGLGAKLRDVNAPFQPERGAYRGNSHTHDHSHDHAHDHEPASARTDG